MRSVLIAVFTATALAPGISTLLAAPPVKSPSPAQLNAWLDQLDDESYVRREQATARLHAAGEKAIDALAAGALSTSPEVAWRSAEALKRIAVSGDERTIDRVATALERVGKQGRAGVVQVVNEIRARQRQLRHDRAAAQIGRLGGHLSGGMAGFGREVFVDVGFMPVAAPAIELAEVEIAEAKAVEAAAAETREAVAKAADEAELAAKRAAVAAAEAAALAPAAAPPAIEDPPAKLEDDLSLEIVGGQRLEEVPVDEPVPSVEDFRELTEMPIDAEPVRVEEPAVAVDFVADADVVAVGPIFLDGPFGGVIDVSGESGIGAEALLLDANWSGGDAGLSALRDLPDVTTISIQSAKLTDGALEHIAALPKLSNIDIRGTVFSVAALRALHKARPHMSLFCQGEAMVGIHADRGGSCVLTSVYPTSGAAEAGLREGDKIVAIDGVEIRDFAELTISVYGHKVGEKLKIEYERDGQRQTAQVELKERAKLEP